MHSKEEVAVFLRCRERGMGVAEAAESSPGSRPAPRRSGRPGALPRRRRAPCPPSALEWAPRNREGGARHGPEETRALRARRRALSASPRPDREPAAQGGVGRPKSGRLGPGFDLEQEQVRARREIEGGDRPASARSPASWGCRAPTSTTGPASAATATRTYGLRWSGSSARAAAPGATAPYGRGCGPPARGPGREARAARHARGGPGGRLQQAAQARLQLLRRRGLRRAAQPGRQAFRASAPTSCGSPTSPSSRCPAL